MIRTIMNIALVIMLMASLSGCGVEHEIDTPPKENDPPDFIDGILVSDDTDSNEGNDISESVEVFQGSDFDRAVKLISFENDISKNYMLSPMSINMALGMAGNTLNEDEAHLIEEFMGSSIDRINAEAHSINSSLGTNPYREDEEPTLRIANSVWVREGFGKELNQETFNTLRDKYDAEVSEVAIMGASKINSWISEKTNEMIPSIVDSLSPEFMSMLINAIYFEDNWSDTFSESQTTKEEFTSADGTKHQVDMMHGSGNTYLRNSQYEAFRKRYMHGYSFMGIVPIGNRQIDLENINIDTLLESESDKYEVQVAMPKFKFDYSIDMNDALESMGIGGVFKTYAVTHLIDDEELQISSIKHKTAIDMTENGTKAAAVTAVTFDTCALEVDKPKQVKKVELNKPFIFIITDTEGRNMFTGVVNNLGN